MYLKVDLGLKNPDNRVEYELWYSSILDLNPNSIKSLGIYQKPFAKDALFTPRVTTFSCELCPKAIREANCISNGKYCPYRPKTEDEDVKDVHPLFFKEKTDDDPLIHLISRNTNDIELIMESLRASCVYRHVLALDDTLVLKGFYSYMFDMLNLVIKDRKLSKK